MAVHMCMGGCTVSSIPSGVVCYKGARLRVRSLWFIARRVSMVRSLLYAFRCVCEHVMFRSLSASMHPLQHPNPRLLLYIE